MQHFLLWLCSSPAWLCGHVDRMTLSTCIDLSILLLQQHAVQSAVPFRMACRIFQHVDPTNKQALYLLRLLLTCTHAGACPGDACC